MAFVNLQMFILVRKMYGIISSNLSLPHLPTSLDLVPLTNFTLYGFIAVLFTNPNLYSTSDVHSLLKSWRSGAILALHFLTFANLRWRPGRAPSTRTSCSPSQVEATCLSAWVRQGGCEAIIDFCV